MQKFVDKIRDIAYNILNNKNNTSFTEDFKMTIMIRWYDIDDDFKVNYNEEHHGTIKGKNADDCWKQFMAFKYDFNLAKFTIPEIYGMYD